MSRNSGVLRVLGAGVVAAFLTFFQPSDLSADAGIVGLASEPVGISDLDDFTSYEYGGMEVEGLVYGRAVRNSMNTSLDPDLHCNPMGQIWGMVKIKPLITSFKGDDDPCDYVPTIGRFRSRISYLQRSSSRGFRERLQLSSRVVLAGALRADESELDGVAFRIGGRFADSKDFIEYFDSEKVGGQIPPDILECRDDWFRQIDLRGAVRSRYAGLQRVDTRVQFPTESIAFGDFYYDDSTTTWIGNGLNRFRSHSAFASGSEIWTDNLSYTLALILFYDSLHSRYGLFRHITRATRYFRLAAFGQHMVTESLYEQVYNDTGCSAPEELTDDLYFRASIYSTPGVALRYQF